MLDWASFRGRPDVQEANGFSSPGGIPEPAPKKTGISLALGGGCARGWAHIGVLRALDEAGIEISMIARTSIGALVGGCYLAGKLDELEDFARSLTRRRIFGLLEATTPGAGGEIQLTDAIAALLAEHPVHAYRFQGTRFDCGTHIGLIEATIRYALDHEKLSDPARDMMQRALGELGVKDQD